jgi:hypothetical protein
MPRSFFQPTDFNQKVSWLPVGLISALRNRCKHPAGLSIGIGVSIQSTRRKTMTPKQNPKSELRVAFTMQEIRNANRRLPSGPTGIFIQVTLALIFMYLLLISYMMMGTAGMVLVSAMFLVSVFIPVLYQLAKRWRTQRKTAVAEEDRGTVKSEAQQEG